MPATHPVQLQLPKTRGSDRFGTALPTDRAMVTSTDGDTYMSSVENGMVTRTKAYMCTPITDLPLANKLAHQKNQASQSTWRNDTAPSVPPGKSSTPCGNFHTQNFDFNQDKRGEERAPYSEIDVRGLSLRPGCRRCPMAWASGFGIVVLLF
jgi:hypothetical protein